MNRKQFRLTRREFFWGAAGTAVALFISRILKQEIGFSVHQSYTDKTSSIITVLRPEKQILQYKVLTNGTKSSKVTIKIKTTTQYESSVDQIDMHGLQVGILYTLIISENGKDLDQREFCALDIDNLEPRIAVISCTADEWRVDHTAMWKSLFSANPDLIFALGDNIYIDGSSWGWGVLWPVRPSTSRIWRRYIDMRKNLDLYKQRKLTPMMAIWDDHDFGYNGAESEFEHKVYVKNVFEIFFPRPATNDNFESGPGISMAWNAFKTKFIFLDSRFYRVSGADPLTRTQWGSDQKSWLSSQLGKSTSPIWLLNGSQFIGGDPSNLDTDSVAKKHPEDFQWLHQQVIKTQQSITLISGDMHYSEVVKLPDSWGNGVFEITSSALHAIPNAPNGSDNRLALVTENNFIIMHILKSSSKAVSLSTTCFGRETKPLFNLVVVPSKTRT